MTPEAPPVNKLRKAIRQYKGAVIHLKQNKWATFNGRKWHPVVSRFQILIHCIKYY